MGQRLEVKYVSGGFLYEEAEARGNHVKSDGVKVYVHRVCSGRSQAIHCLHMCRAMGNHCHHDIVCRCNSVGWFDPENYETPVVYMMDTHPQYICHSQS